MYSFNGCYEKCYRKHKQPTNKSPRGTHSLIKQAHFIYFQSKRQSTTTRSRREASLQFLRTFFAFFLRRITTQRALAACTAVWPQQHVKAFQKKKPQKTKTFWAYAFTAFNYNQIASTVSALTLICLMGNQWNSSGGNYNSAIPRFCAPSNANSKYIARTHRKCQPKHRAKKNKSHRMRENANASKNSLKNKQ